MTGSNSLEMANIYPNLNEQQLRLNKINFVAEIKERELICKRLCKYIASFDYFDKSLIVSVTTSSISIASLATVIGAPVGMINVSCSLAFSVTTEIVKKLLKTTRNKKKKYNENVMLTGSKLNSVVKYLKHW